jgi:hypothetical protein
MTGKRVCRICGKEYEACHTVAPHSGAFRWQDVACCPEHGAEYLRLIMISRGELTDGEPEEAEKAKIGKTRKTRRATE